MFLFDLANTSYSQTFTSGLNSSSQCAAWASFITLLTVQSYISLTMRGTLNPVGVSVTDPTVIANIALALTTNGTYGPVTSNSRLWHVRPCLGGIDLSADGLACSCGSIYSVRPCIGNSNWGGVNSTTCGGPSQTMIVEFIY